MIKYEKNPINIQKQSRTFVDEKADLTKFNEIERELAANTLIAAGDVQILQNLRFSRTAVEHAFETLDSDFDLLCDTEMLACGIKQKYLENDPICLINKASVISQAKSNKQTRSMVAVDLWKPYLSESIVVIGSESTALSKLMEEIEEIAEEDDDKKPTLIIATPVGFHGAEESKQYLWENHEELGVPCITLLGKRGGAHIAAALMNTLLKLHSEPSRNEES